MSAPSTNVTTVATVNLLSASQPTSPAPSSPTRVEMTWSIPQTAEVVSSRALGLVMLMMPMTQATTRAVQARISIGLGIDFRTGGNSVAATIPANSAIQN